MTQLTEKERRKWSWIIGLGLALFPVHNLWLTQLATLPNGQTLFFIPTFATILWLFGALYFAVNHWAEIRRNLGDPLILGAFVVIALSMGVTGFIYGSEYTVIGGRLAPLFMGFSLIAVYLSARILGAYLFRPLTWVAAAVIVSIIATGIAHPGHITGGLITNYCASAGFIIFAALVSHSRRQWLLVAATLAALVFVGALETLVILTVLGVVVLVRRDWDRRLLLLAGVGVVLILALAVTGHLVSLYTGNGNLDALADLITGRAPLDTATLDRVTTSRFSVAVEAMRHIQPFGHGFLLSPVTGQHTVHNIPLIIVDQIGPLAGAAWLFVVVYCLVKTKWKYAWFGVIAMSLLDHYLWTQMLPWVWGLAGVSTVSGISSDLIFRKQTTKQKEELQCAGGGRGEGGEVCAPPPRPDRLSRRDDADNALVP